MADKSKIEWTEATWNPIRGCSRVSEGCRNCYAEGVAARWSGPGLPYEGLVDGKGRWNGVVKLVPEHLADPLRWKRGRLVFVNSMSDVFHPSVSFETIAAIFGIMAAAPRHTFQVLTKRPERAVEWLKWSEWAKLPSPGGGCMSVRGQRNVGRWPLPNVWLGFSAENQATFDARWAHAREWAARGWKTWVSLEPLLGRVDVSAALWGRAVPCQGCPKDVDCDCGFRTARELGEPTLGWVVVGGESGPNARPMHSEWPRLLSDQCEAADVPYLFKQWGEWCPRSPGYAIDDTKPRVRLTICGCNGSSDLPAHGVPGSLTRHDCDCRFDEWVGRVGKRAAGRLLDGKLHDGYPEGMTRG